MLVAPPKIDRYIDVTRRRTLNKCDPWFSKARATEVISIIIHTGKIMKVKMGSMFLMNTFSKAIHCQRLDSAPSASQTRSLPSSII